MVHKWCQSVNRNIMSMLCCFAKGNHTHWDVHIPEFMFALNSLKHDATGYSPAELFLNRKIIGPGENMRLQTNGIKINRYLYCRNVQWHSKVGSFLHVVLLHASCPIITT